LATPNLHQIGALAFLSSGFVAHSSAVCRRFADVVESSAHVNTAQIVGTQNGEVVVPVYD